MEWPPPPRPSSPASSTAFVISSTNRGMPSVRSMMSCRMFAGSELVAATRSIMASTSRRVSRLIVRAVTCGCPIQGDSNSGRKVMISSTGRFAIRFTVRPNSSRLVGSVQCASSKTISTGFLRASVSSAHRALLAFFAGVAAVLGRVWDNVRRSAAIACRQRAARPGRGRGLRHQGIEFVELCLHCVVLGKAGGTFHLADDGKEGAVCALWRTEIPQSCMRFGGKAFEQRGRQSRFADARLTGEQNHLPFASLCLRPAPQEQFEFFFRPTSSVTPPACRASKRLSTEHGRSAAHARTGPSTPFRSFAPRSLSSNRLPTSLRVFSAITTLFGSAMPCRRAARLGVSPTIVCSWEAPEPIRSPTTTRPVAMPTRVYRGAWVFRPPTAATNSSPARTARSASSSCACG